MRPAFLDNMSWRMAEVYEAVTDRILINMARYFPYIKDDSQVSGSFEYQARLLAKMGQVNRESAQIIRDSLQGADDALKQSLEAAIMDALKNEEPKLRKAAQQGLLNGSGYLPPEVDAGTMQAFQAYYRQSADKLNLVNTVMLESTQQAYAATVADVTARISRTQGVLNEATGEVVMGASSWNQAVRDGVKKMVDNGLTGFVDHGGHRWSPEAYVAMDVRTTMFNTGRAAVAERAEQYGCDLYQVSSHSGARPLCYPWQGKVISRSDWSGEVEDLDGNKVHVYAQSETSYGEPAGLFGINCKHYPMTFIPGFSTLKGEPQDPEENEKTYAESQQQRALERKLREEKRDLEVMKAQGAPEEQIKAQQQRVRSASAEIDDFCDETGRTRRRSRESAPTRATWPDEQGRVERYQGGYTPAPPSGPDDGGNPPSPANIHLGPDNIPPQGQAQTATPQNVAQQATQEPETVVQSTQEQYRLTGLSGDYADTVDSKFKAGNETARKAWEKHIPTGGCVEDAHYSGTPHHKDGKVYLDIEADAKNQRGAGCTFFHENGHALDYYAGWLSDDGAFLAALRADYEAALQATGMRRKADQQFALSMELFKPEVADKANGVSDILDELSKGKCSGRYGHGAKYWRDRPTGVQREAFAHMMEAAFLEGQREMITQYFPTAYARFIELLEGAQ